MFYSSITDILLVIEPVYDHLCFIASEINLILANAELDYGNYSVLFMLTIYLLSLYVHWIFILRHCNSLKKQDSSEGSKLCLIKKKKDRALPSNTLVISLNRDLLSPDQVSPQSY